jgi:hypothetical protein
MAVKQYIEVACSRVYLDNYDREYEVVCDHCESLLDDQETVKVFFQVASPHVVLSNLSAELHIGCLEDWTRDQAQQCEREHTP